MSVQVEKLEKNMAKLTIEVSSEEFEKAIAKAYKKNKNKISMPGFRKLFLMLMQMQLKKASLKLLHSLKLM